MTLNAIKAVIKKRTERGASIKSIVAWLTHLINDTYNRDHAMIKAIEALIAEVKESSLKKTENTLALILGRKIIKERELKAKATSTEGITSIINEYKRIFDETKAHGINNAISALSKYYAVIELKREGLVN